MKKFLNILLLLLKKLDVVKEFLKIPTTPIFILELFKIKLIQIIFFIGTVILLLYPLKEICIPFFLFFFKSLNINTENILAALRLSEELIKLIEDLSLNNYLKFFLKIFAPFKCIYGIKIILDKNMFNTKNKIKGIIFRILYGVRLLL